MIVIRKSARAFSTPEVLLSVFILATGLVTIVAVMSGSLGYSLRNQDAIVATELAQEGVELVRNVRDNDFVAGNNGFTHFSNQHNCRVSWDDDATADIDCAANGSRPSNTPARYYLQYSGGLYKHTGGAQERFSRYIYINTTGSSDNERAEVRSFVYWGTFVPADDGSSTGCAEAAQCIFTESFLTAWKP